MSEQDDRQFLKSFGTILVGLVAFAAVILVVAVVIHKQAFDGEQSAARQAAVEERIRPVAGVFTSEAEQVAAREAAARASAPAESESGQASASADEEPADGGQVYAQVCAACHDTGAAGAPRLVAAEMGARLEEKGREPLVSNAINGIGAMPPKGGRADLSDDAIAASVDYMLDQTD